MAATSTGAGCSAACSDSRCAPPTLASATKVMSRITLKDKNGSSDEKTEMAAPGPGTNKTRLIFTTGPMQQQQQVVIENLMMVLLAKSKNVYPVALITGVYDERDIDAHMGNFLPAGS